MAKRKSRKLEEINASSMADIAFLLLVFFLMVTKIDVDKGIFVSLPEWTDAPPPDAKVNDRNMFLVMANTHGQLLVEEKLSDVKELKDMAKRFVMNNGANPDLSDSPKDAVISFAYDRSTEYSVYIEVYNELRAAFNEIRNNYCDNKWGISYYTMMATQESRRTYKPYITEVRDLYPMNISEAKPKDFGGN